MLQLSNISMTKYVMIIKYFYDTVVSQFSGLSTSPQKSTLNRNSPLNRIIPMVWFDHFCCASGNKNSPRNHDNPLNRSPLNRDTTVLGTIRCVVIYFKLFMCKFFEISNYTQICQNLPTDRIPLWLERPFNFCIWHLSRWVTVVKQNLRLKQKVQIYVVVTRVRLDIGLHRGSAKGGLFEISEIFLHIHLAHYLFNIKLV